MGLSFAAQAHTPVRWYFNPRAPCGARPAMGSALTSVGDFNPRAPCGARPPRPEYPRDRCIISIHAPLAGRDTITGLHTVLAVISIHAPLAGRDLAVLQRHRQPLCISIHAPLAGRDIKVLDCTDEELMISIHAPLAGRDICTVGKYPSRNLFQSTRPLRGATFVPDKVSAALGYFNPRAIVGGKVVQLISIHAPLAGRDSVCAVNVSSGVSFQSTRPLRGATRMTIALMTFVIFQSTRPLRGATVTEPRPASLIDISIHAPLAGRDDCSADRRNVCSLFQSTRPLRGATS